MERKLYSPSEIQKKLWGRIIEDNGLSKRIDQMRRGHLPNGLSMADMTGNLNGFSKILGDFAPRVLLLTDPNNPLTLLPEQIAVAGGWCALRTKDVVSLSNDATIMDPATSTVQKVTSPEQVATWIRQAVAFDQIVESVGTVNANEFALISERKLWSQRTCAKLESILRRRLTEKEKNGIEHAVEDAELIRSTMTERYIQYVTGSRGFSFQRVIDEDIWAGLSVARDRMMAQAGLSLWYLQSAFPKDSHSIPSSSLVWSMYSEPYFDMFRRKDFIQAKTVFIVEPTQHAIPEMESENLVAQRVYQEKGVYFDPNGFNPNTGYIAYMECINEKGKSVRKELRVGEVPNITNWRLLFQNGNTLDPEMNGVLDPKKNKIFLWGVNLLPYGKTQEALLRIVELQDEFKQEKDVLISQFKTGGTVNKSSRERIQQAVAELRARYQEEIIQQNQIVKDELLKLFEYLTKGVV